MARTPKYDEIATNDSTSGDAVVVTTEAIVETVAEEIPASVEVAPPTLHDAFWTLTDAMLPLLEENQLDYLHCQEIRMWFTDGNHAISWAHAIALLEGVMGVRLARP